MVRLSSRLRGTLSLRRLHVLLVTSDIALAVARGQLTKRQALERFGVSEKMFNWRLYMTGSNKIVARARARAEKQ